MTLVLLGKLIWYTSLTHLVAHTYGLVNFSGGRSLAMMASSPGAKPTGMDIAPGPGTLAIASNVKSESVVKGSFRS